MLQVQILEFSCFEAPSQRRKEDEKGDNLVPEKLMTVSSSSPFVFVTNEMAPKPPTYGHLYLSFP